MKKNALQGTTPDISGFVGEEPSVEVGSSELSALASELDAQQKIMMEIAFALRSMAEAQEEFLSLTASIKNQQPESDTEEQTLASDIGITSADLQEAQAMLSSLLEGSPEQISQLLSAVASLNEELANMSDHEENLEMAKAAGAALAKKY